MISADSNLDAPITTTGEPVVGDTVNNVSVNDNNDSNVIEHPVITEYLKLSEEEKEELERKIFDTAKLEVHITKKFCVHWKCFLMDVFYL